MAEVKRYDWDYHGMESFSTGDYVLATDYDNAVAQRDAEVYHHGETNHCLREMIAERDALRGDAERYRWLKANHLQTGADSWIRTGDDLEEAIDAALALLPGEKQT